MRSSSISNAALASSAVLAAIAVGCTLVQSDPGTPRYVSSGTATLEVNVERQGSDYRSFDVASGRPEECRDTCVTEPQCVAFTFVSPGLQGPRARCWLKSAVPAATANPCCTSGIKNAAPQLPVSTAAPAPERQGSGSPPA